MERRDKITEIERSSIARLLSLSSLERGNVGHVLSYYFHEGAHSRRKPTEIFATNYLLRPLHF